VLTEGQSDDAGPGPDRSDGHGGQPDNGIIAYGRDAFQRDVTGALNGPFAVLLEQDGADEAGDSVLVGEDAYDLSAALDLAIEPLALVSWRINPTAQSYLYAAGASTARETSETFACYCALGRACAAARRIMRVSKKTVVDGGPYALPSDSRDCNCFSARDSATSTRPTISAQSGHFLLLRSYSGRNEL
jgi:hypothetical protein